MKKKSENANVRRFLFSPFMGGVRHANHPNKGGRTQRAHSLGKFNHWKIILSFAESHGNENDVLNGTLSFMSRE